MSGFNPYIHMPGVWRCAKCNFQLHSVVLDAVNDRVGARDEPGEKCPNDGSPLWRVTWKDSYKELYDEAADLIAARRIADRIFEEEAAALSFTGPNPDFNGLPDHVVTVCAGFTDWNERQFRADTILDCLRAIEDAQREFEGRQS